MDVYPAEGDGLQAVHSNCQTSPALAAEGTIGEEKAALSGF